MTQGLTAGQVIVLMAFAAGWLLVYACASVSVGRYVVRRIARRPAKASTALVRWLKRGVVAMALVGLLCAAYAYFIEPYWLQVRYVQLTSAKLPAGQKPIRIVHVSDLHCEAKPRLEARAADEIAALKPDLIIYTGDSLNSLAGLETCREFLRRLSAVAPTYAVEGNWDHYFAVDPFEQTGVVELGGRTESLTIRQTPLNLVGWPCGTVAFTVPRASSLSDSGEALNIMLYHRPDYAPDAAAAGFDLYFAGHTHGGQIALPGYGALVTLASDGKRFEGGSYRIGETFINVNRGLGLEGHLAPRVRFLARPEITVIDVLPREQTK